MNRLSISLSEDVYEEVCKIADEYHISLSDVISLILAQTLKKKRGLTARGVDVAKIITEDK